MKTKMQRGRELAEAAIKLSTSDLLSPSSTACWISGLVSMETLPHLKTLNTHLRAYTHAHHADFTSLSSKMKQDNLSATCDFLVF